MSIIFSRQFAVLENLLITSPNGESLRFSYTIAHKIYILSDRKKKDNSNYALSGYTEFIILSYP